MRAGVPKSAAIKHSYLSPTHSSIRSLQSLMHDVLPAIDTYERLLCLSCTLSSPPQTPSVHVSMWLCEPVLPYLTVKQQVQLSVDPLLYIQPPLQVLAVVFDCQLAQLAVRRLFCFVRCLEHHPGLGAWV